MILTRNPLCAIFVETPYFAPGVTPITPTLLAVILHEPAAFGTAINVPIIAHQWASWLFWTPSEAVLAVRDNEYASSNIPVISCHFPPILFLRRGQCKCIINATMYMLCKDMLCKDLRFVYDRLHAHHFG